jgi:Ulp1 family protease
VNKQSETRRDQKTKKPPLKLRDLASQKDSKGEISAAFAVPASLEEFLKRDSVPIKS